MFCKSCGRSLFDSGEERFCCPYCGAEVIASESAADGGFESASANPSGTWTRAGLKERALALLSPGYWPLVLVILMSWGVALFEYSFMIPANRIGAMQNGGPFNRIQLKVIQECISLAVFCIIANIMFQGTHLHWNHILAFLLIICAVYLVFMK